MVSINKMTVSVRLNYCLRQFSLSTCHWRRKPKPERDMSKRNLQGEALEEHMRRRAASMETQKVNIFVICL